MMNMLCSDRNGAGTGLRFILERSLRSLCTDSVYDAHRFARRSWRSCILFGTVGEIETMSPNIEKRQIL